MNSYNYDICKIEAEEAAEAERIASLPTLDIHPGNKVIHKKFGEGYVASVDGDRIKIEFADGMTKIFSNTTCAKINCLEVCNN